MKKILNFVIICLCLLQVVVNATSASSRVCSYRDNSRCTNYQDSSINANGIVYFSHRMESVCINNHYVSPTYTNPEKKVTCSNGNTSPQTVLVKTGCPTVGNVCNNGTTSYCSVVIKYDCNKTKSGASYFTTTTTTTKKTTTTRRRTTRTTTTPTTTVAKSNTNLKSLSLSNGSINFKSDVYEYSISVGYDVNSINVTAIPEDNKSKVEVKNNSNIVNGSVISIIVTGEDKTKSEYKITVKKDTYIMSNNAKLKSLSIGEYDIEFNPKVNQYTLLVDSDITELKVSYEVDDNKSSVMVEGNKNIKNGSKIKIIVTAEDGTENTYIIDIMVEKESNTFTIIFVIILVLAILAGAYYIYKKFVLSKSGEKYEYE